MALRFTNATTDNVDVASNQLDDINNFTWWVWFYWDSSVTTNWSGILTKGTSKRIGFVKTTTELEAAVARSTTSAEFRTTPLFSDAWNFFAITHEDGATGDDLRGWCGNLTTPVSEVSYNSGTRSGSGSFTSDASDNFRFGNWANITTRAIRGDISCGGIIDRPLSLPELQSLQYNPRIINGTKLFSFLGDTGLLVHDRSRLGGDGIVGGATRVAYEPRFLLDARLPKKKRIVMPVAAPVGGLGIPIAMHHYKQMAGVN